MKTLIAVLAGLLSFASVAKADRVIYPGDAAVYVTGEYVSCQESHPNPFPTPSPTPRPTRTIRVTVAINRSCLNDIPQTDGKDIARRASRCDDNNPERRALNGNCTLVDSQVDHGLAEAVIARANTIIYDYQKDAVRTAASDKRYLCTIEL